MTENQIHFYGEIQKFDSLADGSLMVSGIASTEAVDAQGEIITAEAMRKALPSYLQHGTVREMHMPVAAGCPIAAHVDDEGRTHFTAKIVDSGTVKKIQEKVLKGFSIGGKAIKKVGNKITELLLKDISVVDIPCNSECAFTVIKFDDLKPQENEKTMSAELIQKFDSLADTVKGLAATVTALSSTVETLSKQKPAESPELAKALADIGDLQKRAKETQDAVVASERNAIIAKMDAEGRVAYNESGVAFKRDELEKMDLAMLKFAARNSAVIPTVAKAIYRGSEAPKIPADVKGSDRIQKAWESDYGDLEEMKKRFPLN